VQQRAQHRVCLWSHADHLSVRPAYHGGSRIPITQPASPCVSAVDVFWRGRASCGHVSRCTRQRISGNDVWRLPPPPGSRAQRRRTLGSVAVGTATGGGSVARRRRAADQRRRV